MTEDRRVPKSRVNHMLFCCNLAHCKLPLRLFTVYSYKGFDSAQPDTTVTLSGVEGLPKLITAYCPSSFSSPA